MMRLLRIAAREYGAYVRTVGFWLSMLMMPAVATISFSAPAWFEKSAPPPFMVVIDHSNEGYAAPVSKSLQTVVKGQAPITVLPPPALSGDTEDVAIRRWMTEGMAGPSSRKLTAVAVIRGSGDAVRLDFWSSNLADRALERQTGAALAAEMQARRLSSLGVNETALRQAQALEPTVVAFSPRAGSDGKVSLRDRLPGIVGFGAAMLLWMMIFTGAGILLNSVIEEKSSRVLEVLLASASVPEIMFGKILGVAGVTLTVLAVWASVGGTALAVANPSVATDVFSVMTSNGLIFYFLFYLVGGYLMYAAIFTAIGSFCETTREAQTLLGPIMGLLIIPVLFLPQAIRRPDAPLLETLSWIPPFTPFLMTARAASQPPLWEVLGTGVLMAATVALVVWIAGRAFRAGALSTGKIDLKGLVMRIRGGE